MDKLLMETGDALLQEDTFFILLNVAAPAGGGGAKIAASGQGLIVS